MTKRKGGDSYLGGSTVILPGGRWPTLTEIKSKPDRNERRFSKSDDSGEFEKARAEQAEASRKETARKLAAIKKAAERRARIERALFGAAGARPEREPRVVKAAIGKPNRPSRTAKKKHQDALGPSADRHAASKAEAVASKERKERNSALGNFLSKSLAAAKKAAAEERRRSKAKNARKLHPVPPSDTAPPSPRSAKETPSTSSKKTFLVQKSEQKTVVLVPVEKLDRSQKTMEGKRDKLP